MWIRANLRADGTLDVGEEHALVFHGADIVERTFRPSKGTEVEITGVGRYDEATDTKVRLTPAAGNVPGVDQWTFDGTTLQWRAVRSSGRTVYYAGYMIRNAVVAAGGGYRLAYDFLPPHRMEPIKDFRLQFTVDPSWQTDAKFTAPVSLTNVPPYGAFALDVPLAWNGTGVPPVGAVRASGRPRIGLAVLAGVLFAAIAMQVWFEKTESASGRYEAPPDVTPESLQEILLAQRPEVVAAAVQRDDGEAEVASMIAALAVEKAIEVTPGAPPRMRLLVAPETLDGAEQAFIQAIFVAGDAIDSDALKNHYDSGFDQEGRFRKRMRSGGAKMAGEGSGCGLTFLLMAASIAVLGFALPAALPRGIAIAAAMTFVCAFVYRWLLLGRWAARLIGVPLLIVAILATDMPIAVAAALVIFGLALVRARFSGSPEQLRRKRALDATHDYFVRQFRDKKPIEERFVPYLFALDLVLTLEDSGVVPKEWVHAIRTFASAVPFAPSRAETLILNGAAKAISVGVDLAE